MGRDKAVAASVGAAEPQPEKRRNLKTRLAKAGIIGSVALLGMGFAWKYFQRSGEYEKFDPTVNKPVQFGDTFRMASWNMHGQAATRYKQIGRLARHYNLDAIALQEVTTDDAKALHKYFKSWHEVFVLADIKQHVADGGYGNVLITRQKPEDIRTKSFAGTSLLATAVYTTGGFAEDLATMNTSLSNTKDGLQESRAAVAETIKMKANGKLQDIRIMTGHIAGIALNSNPSIHDKQFKDMFNFIADNVSDNYPTIVCGDFNSSPEEVIPAFANDRMITLTNSKATSLTGRTIDYCAYHDTSALGLGELKVLNSPATDHRPLIATWYPQP